MRKRSGRRRWSSGQSVVELSTYSVRRYVCWVESVGVSVRRNLVLAKCITAWRKHPGNWPLTTISGLLEKMSRLANGNRGQLVGPRWE